MTACSNHVSMHVLRKSVYTTICSLNKVLSQRKNGHIMKKSCKKCGNGENNKCVQKVQYKAISIVF